MTTPPTITRLARDLELAKAALRVIRTWASYKEGYALNPVDVKKLCDETLEKLKD